MELFAYRCEKCGKLTHPKRIICDVCGGRNYSSEPLEGYATLLTHTRVHNLPVGIDKPYLDFGIVEFDNGVRVTGQLEMKGEAVTGMRVLATVGTVRQLYGEDKQGFIFKEDN